MSALLHPTALALACVAGVALQLLQSALWPAAGYGALAGAGLLVAVAVAVWWLLHHPAQGRRAVPLTGWLGLVCLALALTGAQALQRQAQRMDPALEGQDLWVVAVVAAMPVRTPLGLRLRLAVEQAGRVLPPGAEPGADRVTLPATLEVVWYDPAQNRFAPAADAAPPTPLPPVAAGERWRWPLRLKAPHGARNPHGFDWELWLWEQGVGATGYVRDGKGVAAPVRLEAAGWRRPVEGLRQQVRDAILARAQSAAPAGTDAGERARAMGVVAALVTGDQRSIGTGH